MSVTERLCASLIWYWNSEPDLPRSGCVPAEHVDPLSGSHIFENTNKCCFNNFLMLDTVEVTRLRGPP